MGRRRQAQAKYELHGDVDKVVFPCGYTLAPDGDTLRIYYGVADTSIAMATASVRAMLEWLDEQDKNPASVKLSRRSTDRLVKTSAS